MRAICGKVNNLWKHTSECSNTTESVQQWAKAEIRSREFVAANKENTRLGLPMHTVPLSSPALKSSSSHQLSRTPSMVIQSLPPPESVVPPQIRISPLIIEQPLTPAPVLLEPAVMQTQSEVFYGETQPVAPWPNSYQAEFAADLCRLMLVCNVAWWAVDQPYWRRFFEKWMPSALLPGSKLLSGRILDEEAAKVVEGMKSKVKDRFATGQCNGWKNIVKSSIVASTINVEHVPYLLNTFDISGKPKTAENLLEIVSSEIKYSMDVLRVKIVAWLSDAGGDSAKMRRLLVCKMPHIIVIDCWSHQVNLIVGDIFKIKGIFAKIIDDALEVVKWFNNASSFQSSLDGHHTIFVFAGCLS
ncbi:hypothetical protein PAXRUDRAFT_836014 [Paxillus rubicundulus Ve08.2h10]|uniref:DUF659 domain-containing protein n=1 Tax=Paxillus rubicundulus Ve08.2h10 TaxID=930991 RepID=A0A0D0DAN2_9AGAM|nr:hypothetical protein PAXRUDRAFT_836014 [Paxillus rubicundulus Ve08.2h10]